MIHQGSTKRDIEAQVTISKTYSNEDPYVSVTVEDKKACQTLVEIKMSMLEFAKMITNSPGYGSGVVYLNDNIGRKQFVKSIAVPFDPNGKVDISKACEDFARKEYPDWRLDPVKSLNWNHYNSSRKTYTATVRKWE